ncbi:hypothetical protein [uncultured Chloroflexus sp.]|uniref:hypothetical protein n=1 Tax=uncultured Chloroflexus sp. TaxID=214040 RepID=UPI00260BD48E|nr:hypothetical protein [uncultured Chloroflexus sp.]
MPLTGTRQGALRAAAKQQGRYRRGTRWNWNRCTQSPSFWTVWEDCSCSSHQSSPTKMVRSASTIWSPALPPWTVTGSPRLLTPDGLGNPVTGR